MELSQSIALLLAEADGFQPEVPAMNDAELASLQRLNMLINASPDSGVAVAARIAKASTKALDGYYRSGRLSEAELQLLRFRVITEEGAAGLEAGKLYRHHRRMAEIRKLEKVQKPASFDTLQYIERKRVDELAQAVADGKPEAGPAPGTQFGKRFGERDYMPGSQRGEIWAELLKRLGAAEAERILAAVTEFATAQRTIAALKAEDAADKPQTGLI